MVEKNKFSSKPFGFQEERVFSMFYERFLELCKDKGVSTSKAAIDAGLSKSTVTKWKKDPTSKPSGNVITKLCNYFGVTVADLLGTEEEDPDRPRPTRADIKFALFGGSEDITDEMYNEVLSFAAYVRQREEAKKNPEEE